MKYRVKAYLAYNDIIGEPNYIRYKLQRRGWFGIYWTVNRSNNKADLDKQANELNLLINS